MSRSRPALDSRSIARQDVSAAQRVAATSGATGICADSPWRVPSGSARPVEFKITPKPGALSLRSLPLLRYSISVESSPGVVQVLQILQCALILTVGPAPIGERLKVPTRLAATCRFTTRGSPDPRAPAPRSGVC